MRSPTESRTEQAPPQPVNDSGGGGLREPPSWYLSSWELRVGLTIIEHDDMPLFLVSSRGSSEVGTREGNEHTEMTMAKIEGGCLCGARSLYGRAPSRS